MASEVITTYVGLGSNLYNPIEQLNRALTALTSLPTTCVVQASSFYQSEALIEDAQNTELKLPDYVNAVAELITQLSPLSLLDNLQQIETNQGRIRDPHKRWQSRSLDLDILLYANKEVIHDRLHIPHYDLTNRNFVLIPLLEIAPELKLPNGSYIKTFLNSCRAGNIHKLA